MFRFLATFALLTLSSFLIGCGQQEKKPVVEKPDEVAEDEPTSLTVDVDDLSELGEYLTPVFDEGRVKFAPPKGWYLPPRDSKYVIRFQSEPNKRYPRIMVTVSDYEDVLNVTSENIEAFADQVLADLEESGVAEKLKEEVAPIQIGPVSGVRYCRRGRIEGYIVDLEYVETVVSGRKYVFQLRTLKDGLPDSEPDLWAVVAGAKFVEQKSGDTEPQPLGDPEDDPFG